ncbi:MAG: Rieske (2Fe-2S) protein [Acidobacteria bacterium]|nr:Rieske (2Fe-2S) protein [Acidobacteriota bacterium]
MTVRDRRRFVTRMSKVAMAAGLSGGYGGFVLIAGRYLYPSGSRPTARQFVSRADGMEVGDSLLYRAPSGESIHVTRQGSQATARDFVALSSTCPHLGCRVHWEARNNRYFCPCHNGVFDPSGVATSGPPAEAGQSLPRYPLAVRDGLIFIVVPAAPLVLARRNR